MPKKDFEERVREVDRLRSVEREIAIPALRKALRDRNNYFVSKAATVGGELMASELVPDLLEACDRFFVDAPTKDPQCWAKIACAKALRDLGHRDADVFLRGVEHIQMEPVWGGEQDSAGPLRAACLMALVDCHIDATELMTHLGDRLADTDPPVRAEAAMAIGQIGLPYGAPLLRLKARVGDIEPAVVGSCLTALLQLESTGCVEFVASFLDADPDLQIEAAAALGAARDPHAVEILTQRFPCERSFDLRKAILASLGASTLPASADFLVEVISEPDQDLALTALESLAASRFATKYRDQAEAAVQARGGSTLKRAFERHFDRDTV